MRRIVHCSYRVDVSVFFLRKKIKTTDERSIMYTEKCIVVVCIQWLRNRFLSLASTLFVIRRRVAERTTAVEFLKVRCVCVSGASFCYLSLQSVSLFLSMWLGNKITNNVNIFIGDCAYFKVNVGLFHS